MDDHQAEGWFLPSPSQELLLKAALLPGPDALAAWEQWKGSADLGMLDEASQRLLPLLYHHLTSQGIHDSLLRRFKGSYRRTWCLNQLLTRDMASLLEAFQRVKIPTLLLKGASLIVGYYRDPGLRPMHDLDVLVPDDCFPAAAALLEQQGWSPVVAEPFEHAQDFRKPGETHQVDLHRHVLHEDNSPGIDAEFWTGSVPIQFGPVLTRALNSADQLLHLCEHGSLGPEEPPSPFTWVSDMVTVLRLTGETLDWQRLLRLTEKHHLWWQVHATLGYLHERLAVPLPVAVRSTLAIGGAAQESLRQQGSTAPEAQRGTRYWFHLQEGAVTRLVFWRECRENELSSWATRPWEMIVSGQHEYLLAASPSQ